MSDAAVTRLFFLLGVASLLPWNSLLSASPYMDTKSFPGQGWAEKLTPLFNGVNCLTQLILLALGNRNPIGLLMFACGLGACFSLALMIFSVQPGERRVEERYLMARVCCSVIAFCTALCQSGAGALAGELMTRYGGLMGVWSTGVAAAGILSLGIAVPVTALVSDEGSTSTLFIVLSIVYVISVMSILRLRRAGLLTGKVENSIESIELAESNSNNAVSEPGDKSQNSSSLCRGLPQVLNIFAIYVQTFLVFPTVTAKWKVQPGSLPLAVAEKYGLIHISLFQVFDLVGRVVSEIPALEKAWPSSAKLWILIVLRNVFLVLCFLGWTQETSMLGSPAMHVFSMTTLAFTNGVLTNVAFGRGIGDALPEDRSTIGQAMPLALVVGIVTGSTMSLAVVSSMEKAASVAMTTATPSAASIVL